MTLLIGLGIWCVVAFVLAPVIGRRLKHMAATQSSSVPARGGVETGAGAAALTGRSGAGLNVK